MVNYASTEEGNYIFESYQVLLTCLMVVFSDSTKFLVFERNFRPCKSARIICARAHQCGRIPGQSAVGRANRKAPFIPSSGTLALAEAAGFLKKVELVVHLLNGAQDNELRFRFDVHLQASLSPGVMPEVDRDRFGGEVPNAAGLCN